MLNFNGIVDTNFSLMESINIYRNMAIELFVPIFKTAIISVIFIFFGQAVLALLPNSNVNNICFWVWTWFVFSIAIASFFKTSEDIVLNKTAQIYANISHTLMVAVKLFTVTAIIALVLALLVLPAFYIKNPLFSLPYKALVTIFIIAALPFIYFAPLAVALREANIINSFTFSYYMTLERWGLVTKSILTQIIFVAIIAFLVYFVVSLLFFPNSPDFFDFIFTNAPALSEQARNLYVRFVLWEAIQIFIFTLISAVFVGANTVLFLFLEGSIHKITKNDKRKKNDKRDSKSNKDVKYINILKSSKTVVIDPNHEEEYFKENKNKKHHKK